MPTITINHYSNGAGGTSPTGHVNVTISDGSTTFTFGGNLDMKGGGVFAESVRPGGSTNTQQISQADFNAVYAWATTEIAQTDTGGENYGPIGGNCVDIARTALQIAHASNTFVSQLLTGNSLAAVYATVSDFIVYNGGGAILNAAGEATGGVFAAVTDLSSAFSAAGSALSGGDILGAVDALFDGAVAAVGDVLNGVINAVRSFLDGPIDEMETIHPPLVLDLTGNGVKLTSLHDSHAVLQDADGSSHHVSWVSSGAILAIDDNHNGKVDGLAEISFNRFQPGATSDLVGLSHFDTNHDGALTAADARFGDFVVWTDANGNGVSEAGELSSLTDAGIASINLATNGHAFASGGAFVQNTTTFTTTSGAQGQAYDVVLVGHQTVEPALAA